MRWRTDAIAASYKLEDNYAWILGGTYELETDHPAPIVAWAEFEDPRRRRDPRLLATYQEYDHGGGQLLSAWSLGSLRSDGRVTVSRLPRDAARRYLPGAYPPNPTADPVLLALHDASVARRRAEAEAETRRRAEDPLIELTEEIEGLVYDGADDGPVREVLATLDRAQLENVIVRIAAHRAELADELYAIEEADDDTAPGGSSRA